MNGFVDAFAASRNQRCASARVYAACPANDLRALDVLHVDGNLDLEHVDAVAVLRELRHARGDDLRLLLRVLEALLVDPFLVADEFEEERDVVGAALVADALHPCVLAIVDVVRIERRVVEKNLHRVGADLAQPPRRPEVEEIRQPARSGLVVAGLLVRHEQTGVAGAPLRRRHAPLRIEENRARVRGQDLGDEGLELLHHRVAHRAALVLLERFLQRPALVHRRRGDDAAIVGDGIHAGQFSCCDGHA